MSDLPTPRPSVLFVCIHSAGRSQMAAAWVQHLCGGAVEVRSAGSAPARKFSHTSLSSRAPSSSVKIASSMSIIISSVSRSS